MGKINISNKVLLYIIDTIYNGLKKNLKFFRKQMGLTQEQLAIHLHGHKSLVSNYENGHSVPDIFTLITLADLFKVSLDELVGRI